MNIESELNYLKAKQEATEAIHAALLSVYVRLMPDPDAILAVLRTAFAPDAAPSANMDLLIQQYLQDAIDRIERLVRFGNEEPPG